MPLLLAVCSRMAASLDGLSAEYAPLEQNLPFPLPQWSLVAHSCGAYQLSLSIPVSLHSSALHRTSHPFLPAAVIAEGANPRTHSFSTLVQRCSLCCPALPLPPRQLQRQLLTLPPTLPPCCRRPEQVALRLPVPPGGPASWFQTVLLSTIHNLGNDQCLVKNSWDLWYQGQQRPAGI